MATVIAWLVINLSKPPGDDARNQFPSGNDSSDLSVPRVASSSSVYLESEPNSDRIDPNAAIPQATPQPSELIRIHGVFVDTEERPAPSGIAVYAVDLRSWRIADDRKWKSDSIETIGVMTTTNDDGEFEFDELALGRDYVVLAVGDDCASSPQVFHASSADSRFRIRGGRAYYARVSLEADGLAEIPEVSVKALGSGIGISESYPARDGVQATYLHRAIRRALIGEDSDNQRASRFDLFAFAPFHRAREVEATVRVGALGFAPTNSRVALQPVSTPAKLYSVQLTSVASGWGTVSVSLHSAGNDMHSGEVDVAHLEFSTFSEQNRAPNTFLVPIDLASQRSVIPGFPTGDYRVRMLLRNGLVEVSPIEFNHGSVEIVDKQETSISFDLSDLSVAEFALSGSRLVAYDGTFDGVLIRDLGGNYEPIQFHFTGPPYRFVGLPAGEYRLMTDPPVMYPPPADPESAGAPFQVGGEGPPIIHDLEVKL